MTLTENKSKIQKLQDKIQQHAEEILKCKWKIGDNCLVFHRLKHPGNVSDFTNKQWYRGKINEVNPCQNQVCCFLLDYGKIIKAELNSLMEMPEEFNQILEGSIKCHLANCTPTGKILLQLLS